MKSSLFSAVVAGVTLIVSATATNAATVYSGSWGLTWDFQDGTYQGWQPYANVATTPVPLVTMPGQGNPTDMGLRQANVASPGGIYRYVEYRLPQTYTQFIFQTDIAWNTAVSANRAKSIGMAWRNDPLDNGIYTSEGWLEGNNFGIADATDRDKLRLGGTDIPTSPSPNNAQGILSTAGLTPGSGGLINLTLQVQYNWENSGVYNVFYRSNSFAGNYGAGNWQLLATYTDIAATLDGINELKLGGNASGTAWGEDAHFDNVKFIGAVPEPGSIALLGIAIPALAGLIWRQRKTVIR